MPFSSPAPNRYTIVQNSLGLRPGWGLGGGEFPIPVSLITDLVDWIIIEDSPGSKFYKLVLIIVWDCPSPWRIRFSIRFPSAFPINRAVAVDDELVRTLSSKSLHLIYSFFDPQLFVGSFPLGDPLPKWEFIPVERVNEDDWANECICSRVPRDGQYPLWFPNLKRS